MNRRHVLQTATGLLAAAGLCRASEVQPRASRRTLIGEIGVVGGLRAGGQATPTEADALDMPRRVREELDLCVIDLTTAQLPSLEPAFLDRLRAAAVAAGCEFTNLKMNQRGLDMNSLDTAVRERALATYRRTIDAAVRLGCRWARPLPSARRPDQELHIDSYRALAAYAAQQDVQLLVENYGWMSNDAQSVVRLVKAVGNGVAACPDTGNWSNNAVRYAGLASAFPLAVSCDFKARSFDEGGAHPDYDLKRCFEIGWKAGFRGPWCIEYGHKDRDELVCGIKLVRNLLRQWIAEKQA